MFSLDGKRSAYVAIRPNGKCVVLDGNPQLVAQTIHGRFMKFSPDGSRFSYAVFQHGREAFVLDGVVGPWFDSIYSSTFSPDSRRAAYVDREGSGRVVVAEGLQPLTFPEFGGFAFSPDGKTFTFAAARPAPSTSSEQAFTAFLVTNGKEKEIGPGLIVGISYSPDGKHVDYGRHHADKASLTFGGVEQCVPNNGSPKVLLTPDRKRRVVISTPWAKGGVAGGDDRWTESRYGAEHPGFIQPVGRWKEGDL